MRTPLYSLAMEEITRELSNTYRPLAVYEICRHLHWRYSVCTVRKAVHELLTQHTIKQSFNHGNLRLSIVNTKEISTQSTSSENFIIEMQKMQDRIMQLESENKSLKMRLESV